MIRIDAVRIAVEPLGMRSAVDMALGRVVSVFGEGRSHHAYLLRNCRTTRLKGFGARGLWAVPSTAAGGALRAHRGPIWRLGSQVNEATCTAVLGIC